MSDQAARRWSVELVGDVVEGQDGAVVVAHALDGQRALHASAEWTSTLASRGLAGHEIGRGRATLRRACAFDVPRPSGCRSVSAERLISRIRHCRIERDDAGGNTRQHRLDEGAAGFELLRWRPQRAGLFLQTRRSSG